MNRRGFSIIEVMIFSGIGAFMLLTAVSFLNKPAAIGKMVTRTEQEREAIHALDRLVADLKEADPSTIPWNVKDPSSSLAFSKVTFNLDTQNYQPPSPVTYYYNPATKDTGSLMRLENGVRSVVLEHVEKPTPKTPLFQKNPHLHLIMISLQYHVQGSLPLRVVRRVAVQS